MRQWARTPEIPWLEPFPDSWLKVADAAPGPEACYETKEAIALAFVVALQRLHPRQRAVLAERYVGHAAAGRFFQWATGPNGPGPFRFVATRANNGPAFGIYGTGPSGPASAALILQVLQADSEGIVAVTSFMTPRLFLAFDLPLAVEAQRVDR